MRVFLLGWFLVASCALGATNLTDGDGDGLPDLWEAHWGLSTNSAVGINGAWGDPDGDGLHNLAEYRAGYLSLAGGNVYSNYTWAVPSLSPTNRNSKSSTVSDFDWKAGAGSSAHLVTLGWMLTDHDRVDSSYELSPNESADFSLPDDETVVDGWNGWERARLASLGRSGPSFAANLSYGGRAALGNVFISASSDLTKAPDAVFSISAVNSETNLIPVSGRVLRTSRYWLALPNSGSWNANLPVGWSIADPSWDANKLEFCMRRARGTLLTINLPEPAATLYDLPDTRVRIRRSMVDGLTNAQHIPMDETYRFAKTLSAVDWIMHGQYAMDWGLVNAESSSADVIVYEVFVGDQITLTNNVRVTTFTNRFESVQATPVPTSPRGGSYVNEARPTLRWGQPEQYHAFGVELWEGSTNGTLLFASGAVERPPDDPLTGDCVYRLPIHAGDRMTNGTVFKTGTNYHWRVMAYDAKYNPERGLPWPKWSAWSSFAIPADEVSGNVGAIRCSLAFAGVTNPVHGARTIIGAWRERGFCGVPESRLTLTAQQVTNMLATGTATNLLLRGLAPGTYHIMSWLDQNGNGVRDAWESWGYADQSAVPGAARLDVSAVEVRAGKYASASVTIRDTDSDGDWLPDSWEYSLDQSEDFLSVRGPSPQVNPLLN